MLDFLQTINTVTNGSTVILGGVAKWQNGYGTEPTSKFIDIAVTPQQTSSLDTLGTRLEIQGGTTFPTPVQEQYVLKTDNYILDVFVVNELPQSTLISGSNIQTPEADVQFHTSLYDAQPNDYILGKLNERRTLYGL